MEVTSDDLAELTAIRHSLQAAENAGDADAAATLLADDAVIMAPDFPVHEGRESCLTFLRDILPWQHAQFERHITYVSAELVVDGELAFDRGTFSFTVTPRSGGDRSEVTGKYLWILRRTNGAWKLSRLIAARDDDSRD